MTDLEANYWEHLQYRRFPRVGKILKVSEETRDRVRAWLDAQLEDPMEKTLVELVESRCNYEQFTASSAIAYGLDTPMRHRVYCCLSRMAWMKKIERRGTKGRYAYRLLPTPVEIKVHKSALQSMRAAEVARRYA